MSFWLQRIPIEGQPNISDGPHKINHIPLANCANINIGGQVHDFHQRRNKIIEYINEFELTSEKVATQISDMSELESQQWLLFLKHDNAEILDEFIETATDIDFFDPEFEDMHDWNEEIIINTWKWKNVILTDMYSVTRGQSGAVFVGFDMIFENRDMNLEFPGHKKHWLNIKPNTQLPTFHILNERREALSHLKWTIAHSYCEDNHEHCEKQVQRYDSM